MCGDNFNIISTQWWFIRKKTNYIYSPRNLWLWKYFGEPYSTLEISNIASGLCVNLMIQSNYEGTELEIFKVYLNTYSNSVNPIMQESFDLWQIKGEKEKRHRQIFYYFKLNIVPYLTAYKHTNHYN